MKNILPALAFVILPFSSHCQIPNGGFEQWETLANYEKPLSWNTNQDPQYERFQKDTVRVEGDYALKVVASSETAWTQCMSMASTSVQLSGPAGPGQSLYFFARSLAENASGNTFLKVSGKWYAGSNFVADFEWENFDEINEFREFEIPIPQPDVDSFSIQIFGGALNGAADGCHNQSVSWLDGLEIRETTVTNISRFDENRLSIYPNPSRGAIYIQQSEIEFDRYRVIDLLGRTMKSGQLTEPKIVLKQKGMFILILENSSVPNRMFTKKIFVR